jgi:hypothetical protein
MSRTLTRLVALLFALLGAILFVASEWATREFLWNVSPFVTMTIGAFYLGSAVFAWECVRTWRWPSSYAASVYLWALSLLEDRAGLAQQRTSCEQLAQVIWRPVVAAPWVKIVDWARTPEGDARSRRALIH